jgi:hypothetical protein
VFLLATQSSAQQTAMADASLQATVTRDPQSLTLLAQCKAAMGGASILDTYATGTITSTDPNGPTGTIVAQTKGSKMRNDIASGSGQLSFAANGSTGWSVRQGKKSNAPYAATAYYRPEYAPALACIIDPLRPKMNIKYVGLEQVGTASAYHIQFNVSPAGPDDSETLVSDFHVFLDQKTLLVVKTSNFIFDPIALENRSTWETYYSDYRPVNGALVPFHVEHFLSGQKVTDVVFTHVEINKGISDAIFNSN